MLTPVPLAPWRPTQAYTLPTRSRLGQAEASGVVLTRTGLKTLTQAIELLVHPDVTLLGDWSKKTGLCRAAIPLAIEERDKAITFYATASPDQDYIVPVGRSMDAYFTILACTERASTPSNPWPWIIGGLGVAGVITYLVWPK